MNAVGNQGAYNNNNDDNIERYLTRGDVRESELAELEEKSVVRHFDCSITMYI